jgi:hypothetical protein
VSRARFSTPLLSGCRAPSVCVKAAASLHQPQQQQQQQQRQQRHRHEMGAAVWWVDLLGATYGRRPVRRRMHSNNLFAVYIRQLLPYSFSCGRNLPRGSSPGHPKTFIIKIFTVSMRVRNFAALRWLLSPERGDISPAKLTEFSADSPEIFFCETTMQIDNNDDETQSWLDKR